MKEAEHTSLFYFNSNSGDTWLCIGSEKELVFEDRVNWKEVDNFTEQFRKDYIVALIGFDVKNSIEQLHSSNEDHFQSPAFAFIVPQTVYHIRENVADLIKGKSRTDILLKFLEEPQSDTPSFQLHPRLSKKEYLKKIERIQEYIQKGDSYEVNFCQIFEKKNVSPFNYLDTYKRIHNTTKAPFSAFIDWREFKMMGASPERFIKRVGHLLVSQPIKGTRKRGNSAYEDELLKKELINSEKEKAENVMIVDLVRNDLAKVALPGSVKVEELFGLYTFESVHQLISTVICTLREDTTFSQILKATFPMGSMTGAPKIRSLELIEEQENFKRGWYSGSVGLIQPKGNFDLNVVIRTLLYNEKNKYLCCPVGGAITDLSSPEEEYEECLIKIERLVTNQDESLV